MFFQVSELKKKHWYAIFLVFLLWEKWMLQAGRSE